MLDTIWKKITTKPVWLYERNRPYPISNRALELPPITCNKQDTVLAVLTTTDTFHDALWSAWSWLRFLSPLVKLTLFVDGMVTAKHHQIVGTQFPGASIFNLDEFLLDQQLDGGNLKHFVGNYRLGKKAGLLMSLQKTSSVLYCDFDVLAFNEPSEIKQSIVSKQPGCYFNQQPGAGSYDEQIKARAAELGINCPPGFNAGLLWLPHDSLSFSLAEALLEGWNPATAHGWFSEQTLFCALTAQSGARALPPKRYLVTADRQFYWQPDVDYNSIASRHFIYPVRHVMHLKGQPYLLKQLHQSSYA